MHWVVNGSLSSLPGIPNRPLGLYWGLFDIYVRELPTPFSLPIDPHHYLVYLRDQLGGS